MTMAQGVDAHPGEVVGAIDDVGAGDITLIQHYLSAEIAHEWGMWANGDERFAPRVFQEWPIACFKLDDREVAIGVHFIAGGIKQKTRQLRAGKLMNGIDAADEREVADQHVHTIIDIAIDVVNKLVVFEGKSGAGFPGIGAEPGGLA